MGICDQEQDLIKCRVEGIVWHTSGGCRSLILNHESHLGEDCRGLGFRFRVLSFGFWFEDAGFGVQGAGFGV